MIDYDSGCLFCQIAAGVAPASIVYSDDAVLAFMDLRQPSPGHVLVIPKVHRATIFDVEPELAGSLFTVAAKIAHVVQSVYQPDGLNVWQSNGEAAGQEIFHFHFHIFTRTLGDHMFHVYNDPPPPSPRAELDQMAARLRGAAGYPYSGKDRT
jgi:histidine triad (HIT) family protein